MSAVPPIPADSDHRAWLRLSLEPGLTLADTYALLRGIGLPQIIYDSAPSALSRLIGSKLAGQLAGSPTPELHAAVDQGLAWLHGGPHRHLLTLDNPAYPPALLELTDPPPLLYAYGELACLQRPALTIVGSRSATADGLDNARAFARWLAGHGCCIVSGLARGIDGAAHAGALAAGPQGGGTIAVLGTGIDRVYPDVHRDLAHQIVDGGLLISEFPLGASALPGHFPRRNRVVAALGAGILVVEATLRSGSLITARLGNELGREVFAIPGSIHSPQSRGCHRLIREGAKLVETAADIVEELGARLKLPMPASPASGAATRSRGDSHAGRRVAPSSPSGADRDAWTVPAQQLWDALGADPVDVDRLCRRTGLPSEQAQAGLLELELAGVVERQPDGRYRRVREAQS